jgi:hypothetical protein
MGWDLTYEIVRHYNPEQDEQEDQETVEVFLDRAHLAQRERADFIQYFEEATQPVIILAPHVAPMKLSMKIETNQSFDCFGSPGWIRTSDHSINSRNLRLVKDIHPVSIQTNNLNVIR